MYSIGESTRAMCIMVQAFSVYRYFLLHNVVPAPRVAEDHSYPYPYGLHEHACNYDNSELLLSTLRATLYL